ncbi:MAG TPA: tRNA uridine-5-carboxymethylaminomethyl(34) synthesis GTPase MnmE, partial [Ferruginibacter sp.]|nr:tRNA uridine-5-carboxymethylaminomethyl(34) synthesis GTPase MnmE [Ferruginibacter sp.]
MNKLTGWDNTIVALSTAPGVAAIAVVRLSGPGSFEIIDSFFPFKKLSAEPTHTIHVGLFIFDNEPVDEVVVSLFKSPKSYTGEDVIEISCHGSAYIIEQIIRACVSKGARLAKPGEFTQRAFLHGRLDLTQAESVADLIASNTRASQRTALQNIRGGFSHDLKEMRSQLVEFASLIELELDFAAEDVEFADRAKFYELIQKMTLTTNSLLDSFQWGNVIKNGVSVAIIGKPNAGKSTLLNTLLNEDRAIVSEIAGTTRDTIEETINIKGILFRLIDTAGIRAHSSDVIENIGIDKSLDKMRTAGIVLYIFDVNNESLAELEKQVETFNELSINYILVGNKADEHKEDPTKKYLSAPPVHFISAKNNEGIDVLKSVIFESTVHAPGNEDTIITNARHYEALQQVAASLADIKKGLDEKIPGDLLAMDIRRSLYYLGEITGEITNEDK